MFSPSFATCAAQPAHVGLQVLAVAQPSHMALVSSKVLDSTSLSKVE